MSSRGALLFVWLAAAIPAYAQGQKAAPEVKVAGAGKSQSNCAKDAEGKAREAALNSILGQEPTLEAASVSCLATSLPDGAVTIKGRPPRMVGGDRCEVVFTVTYARPAVLAAGRSCRRTEISVPVGIALRAERTRGGESQKKADDSLTQQAIGQIGTALARANFQVEGLPQFQQGFLDLKLMTGPCVFTADPSRADWREECKERFPNYISARDALTRSLSDSIATNQKLQGWRECGGLFLSGEVRLTAGARDVHGEISVDYYALASDVTFIAPYANSHGAPIDLGGEEGAVSNVLVQLAEGVVSDATQKLSKFAHSTRCAAPRE